MRAKRAQRVLILRRLREHNGCFVLEAQLLVAFLSAWLPNFRRVLLIHYLDGGLLILGLAEAIVLGVMYRLKSLQNVVVVEGNLLLHYLLILLLLLDVLFKSLLFVRPLLVQFHDLWLCLLQPHYVLDQVFVVDVDVVKQDLPVEERRSVTVMVS